MHYRGHDANFTLVYPDGSSEEVLNVPNYQFNWQKVYDFKEPKFVPAGTEMVFTGTFDNSEFNPSNPDASQTLSWGEQTWQEMFFGFYRYVEAGNPAADRPALDTQTRLRHEAGFFMSEEVKRPDTSRVVVFYQQLPCKTGMVMTNRLSIRSQPKALW